MTLYRQISLKENFILLILYVFLFLSMSAHGYLTEMFSPLSNGVYSRVPGYIGFISTIIYSATRDLDKRNETDPM